MHIYAVTISLLLLSTQTALAQGAAEPGWGEPIGEHAILLGELVGFPDALLLGPADGRGQRAGYDRMRIHGHGVVDLNPRRDGAVPPLPMALTPAVGPMIAPLWYPFDPPCGGGPLDERVRYGVDDGALLIRWSGMTTGGRACDARAEGSDFSVRIEATAREVVLNDGTVVDGHALRLTFTYHRLSIAGVPRAGTSIEGNVLELFADEGRARTDRAHQLAALGGQSRPACPGDPVVDVDQALAALYPSDEQWSCVAEARCAADVRCTEPPHYLPGRWVIELSPDGEIEGDDDRDGWRSADNCPEDYNPRQPDRDGDQEGNACDGDIDGDRVFNEDDNCVLVRNGDQLDTDSDGQGDACDADDDDDDDGLIDWVDRCPRNPDPTNGDVDADGRGDACDADIDGDDGRWIGGRVEPERDSCPYSPDPDRHDRDGDGIGDACDARPLQPCKGLCFDQMDADGDGTPDLFDLCPRVARAGHRDCDGDGLGDACDPDANGDGLYDVLQWSGDRACRAGPGPVMFPDFIPAEGP